MNMNKIRRIFSAVIMIILVGGAFTYLTFSGRIAANPLSDTLVSSVRQYPDLTGAKTTTLSCDYHGESIEVQETVYSSLANYYKTDPAKLSAYYHNQDDKYVYSYDNDKTIAEIAAKIKAIGQAKGLSSDQTLDLAACLLQSIPYDTAKATKILSDNAYTLPASELVPRYPYETLYEDKGICTDKSFLGVAIFKSLGYSTSLLTFDSQRHMSIGIEVPSGYGDFGSKYAILELTGENFLVGDVPEISGSAGAAVGGIQTLPNVTTDSSNVTNVAKTELSGLTSTVSTSTGMIYTRIGERMALKQAVSNMLVQVQSAETTYKNAKNTLTTAESNLKIAESNYKATSTATSYSAYLSVYNKYVQVYNEAKSSVDNYNTLVNQYNALVTRYREF